MTVYDRPYSQNVRIRDFLCKAVAEETAAEEETCGGGDGSGGCG
jgi:hypothetical protein